MLFLKLEFITLTYTKFRPEESSPKWGLGGRTSFAKNLIMEYINLISLLLLAALFIFAGVSHFRNPKFFLAITPEWVPMPEKVNIFVGAVEVLLGIAVLIPTLQTYAAYGIIALLIAVFPANIYHFQKSLKKGKMVIPTLIRLPIQILLIYWAWSFV